MVAKAVGMDIGYANIKVLADGGVKAIIPSIVGTPNEARFKLVGKDEYIIVQDAAGEMHNVGLGAIEQSRFTARQEDRGWIHTNEWDVLLRAALSTLHKVGMTEALVVTGLPVAFFSQDRDEMRKLIEGTHTIQLKDAAPVIINVTRCLVIPQGMGTVLDAGLDASGNIANPAVANGRVGVIDIGGKTTNLLHAHKMGDVAPETDSIALGGWDAVRAIRDPLQTLCAGVDYKDHEVADAIQAGHINYRGKPLDLSEIIAKTFDPMAAQIVAKARQLWAGEGAKLDAILLSGGGSTLLGGRIMQALGHSNITVVNEPVFSNVRGYYKLAIRARNAQGG